MGKWNDRVTDHAVNGAFDKALAALEGLSKDRIEQAPEDVERLLWVLRHVRTRLEHTPAMAVPGQTLDQLNTQISQIVAELTNFAGNGNAVHLNNAMSSVDAILEQARVLRPLTSEGTADEVQSYLTQVQGLVSTVVTSANDELRRLRETAEAETTEMVTARDSLTGQLVTVSQQVTDVQASVEQQTARLAQALTAHESQFTQQEKLRADTFDTAEQRRAQAADEAERTLSEQFAAAAVQLKDESAETLHAIAEMKKEADELLGAIGVAGVAAGYNETAKQEKAVADRWRLATVTVAIAAAGVLSSTLWVDHAAAGSWQRLATRLILSLSFAGLAAYCGRQSAEHRRVEREARDRQLQLAALNPYLANMPPEQSVALKSELAPGYFTPVSPTTHNGRDADGAGPMPTGQVAELITALLTKGAGR